MNSRLALVATLFAACRPDFGLPVSVVTEPRVIAVEVNPPEAKPGEVVHLKTHVGGPDGVRDAHGSFSFCTSPRPLTETNVVSDDCLGEEGKVAPIADDVEETDAKLPENGCLLYGPETPPSKPGEPALRPRDPDITGGYYQPVRVKVGELEAIALVRIRCNLPGASAERTVEFNTRYTPNASPPLATFTVDGYALDALPANTKVTLRASWSDGTAEPYVVHDRTNDTLVDHRESLRVSWFTTGGLIPLVTSGRGEADTGLDTSTEWQTPAAGSGTLWAVLRDSRGGNSLKVLQYQVR